MSKLDSKALRQAFGTYLTGVTVVTARSESGELVGFTANSFTSVSMEPPLLLVCPAKSLSSYEIFANCQHFAVNILAESQEDVSNLFAGFQGDRFAEVGWHSDEFGSPVLDGATTHFSCSTDQLVDAGDHVLLIGEVQEFKSTGTGGLGYSSQGYFSLGLERGAGEPPSSVKSFRVGAIVENNGTILIDRSKQKASLPTVEVKSRTGALAAIREHLDAMDIGVEFGPVYSIFDNAKTDEYSVYFLAKNNTTHNDNFVELENLSDIEWQSEPQKTMLERYVLERQSGGFALYFGDETEGDVHAL